MMCAACVTTCSAHSYSPTPQLTPAHRPSCIPHTTHPPTHNQIRTLKKKMRQAEALAEKATGGAALSEEEQAKLARLPGWRDELAALEAQL